MSVRRKNHVGDEVRVTVQTFLGNTKVVLLAGKLPDNQSLVCSPNIMLPNCKKTSTILQTNAKSVREFNIMKISFS